MKAGQLQNAMVAVPQHIEDLLSAIHDRDGAQLRRWLDLFSGPAERYAAVRALAESLRGAQSGPAYELRRWATELVEGWLGFSTDTPAYAPERDRPHEQPRYVWSGC
jgi:hypothetical protein